MQSTPCLLEICFNIILPSTPSSVFIAVNYGVMETLLIFVPCALYNEEPGALYGVVQETKEEYVKCYFVIGKVEGQNRNNGVEQCNIIGYYCKGSPSSVSFKQKSDWVLLGLCGSEFILHEIVTGGNVVDMTKPCQTVCIIYDHEKFLQSELFLQCLEHDGSLYGDHFKILATKLNSEVSFHASGDQPLISAVFTNVVVKQIIKLLLCTATVLLNCLTVMHPVLKYTALELHLQTFLQSLIWILQSASHKKKLSIKVWNYIVATIVDVCCGMLLLYWLIAITSSPSQLLLESGEVCTRVQLR
jgi:hypothetical protein